MKKVKGLILTLGFVTLFGSLGTANADSDDPDRLRAALTEANESGITGSATLTIGEDGLRGTVKADHLKPGHAYTVWFFYVEGANVAGPGRSSMPPCAHMPASDAARADNLLTFMCAAPAAQAVFTIS